MRAHSPRYVGANLEHNLALVDAVRGDRRPSTGSASRSSRSPGCSRAAPDIVPLLGARRRERVAEALGALEVGLDDATLAALEQALPPGITAGSRYPEAAMAQLDSER